MSKYLAGVAVLMFVMVSAAVPANALDIPYTATAPTAYGDAIWSSAASWTGIQTSKGTTWYEVNGTSIGSDADCSATVSLLWDSTNLYAKVAVTDDVHADLRDVSSSSNNDSIEFYLNAINNPRGNDPPWSGLPPPVSQDLFGYKGGAIVKGASGINSQLSQFNGTISGGNYTLMGTWAWVGTGDGQLGLAAAPSVNDLIGFGLGVNESDDIAHDQWSFTGRDSEMMFWTSNNDLWTNPSSIPTFTLTPEPATMALLVIGGVGMLIRRRRR